MFNRYKLSQFMRYGGWLSLLFLLSMCAPEQTLEDQIRRYIYGSQPITDEAFVAWAEAELLDEFSSSEIYVAIRNEAELQAERGHPNAVAALSVAARAWANDRRLSYRSQEWRLLQQQAIENLNSHSKPLQIWSN